jgi:hypothetical protein
MILKLYSYLDEALQRRRSKNNIDREELIQAIDNVLKIIESYTTDTNWRPEDSGVALSMLKTN